MHKTLATVTGVSAPLNPVEGSRLTLTYSTMLNSTWASIENKRQPNGLAHCANAHAFKHSDWLDATFQPAYCTTLSSPPACQSQNTVNILHSSVVENAEQQTTFKAFPTLRK